MISRLAVVAVEAWIIDWSLMIIRGVGEWKSMKTSIGVQVWLAIRRHRRKGRIETERVSPGGEKGGKGESR